MHPLPMPGVPAILKPVLAAVACLLVAGCAPAVHEEPAEASSIEALAMRDVPPNPLADTQSRGRGVFHHYCVICHGETGHGDGFNSTNLAVTPRDFSSPDFWQKATDARLLLAVSQGGPAVDKSVLMPAWGRTLSDRQVREVVAFLHTLAPGAASQPSDPAGDARR